MSPLESIESEREVPVDRIAEAITELWRESEEEGADAAPVVRACGLTLIVLSDAGEEAERLAAAVAEASVLSPARTLFVERERGAGLSARVRAFCVLGPGGRHVCQEQVRLRVDPERLADLPSVLAPLAISDLPVVLLAPDPELALDPRLTELRRILDVLAFDLARGADTRTLLPALAERVRHRPYGLRDLAFERDRPWRRAVADVHDAALAEGGTLVEAVALAPVRLAEAWVLLGWIARHAPAPLRSLTVRPPEDVADPDLRGLDLVVEGSGGRRLFRYRRHGSHVVDESEVESRDAVCALPRPLADDARLLADLLADPEPSVEFEESLGRALALVGGGSR